MSDNLKYKFQQTGSADQIKNRSELNRLFQESPLPIDHLMVNLALYMRSSVLAKTLYINELYTKIKHLPGSIFEFGSWYGTNIVLFESINCQISSKSIVPMSILYLRPSTPFSQIIPQVRKKKYCSNFLNCAVLSQNYTFFISNARMIIYVS